MAHPQDEAALRRAHGLRQADPLALLDARFRTRGREGDPPAREAAAALLADASRMRGGCLLYLALDLAGPEALPTRFDIPAGSVACAWSTRSPPPGPVAAGRRRARLAAPFSPLRVDWAASLAARVRGEDAAMRLLGGTPVEAARAHDPALPRLMPPAALALARSRVPGPLAWSVAAIPLARLLDEAGAAGLAREEADLPDGLAACLAADGAGNAALLLAPSAPDGEALVAMALGPALDLRRAVRPGGIDAVLPPASIPAGPAMP